MNRKHQDTCQHLLDTGREIIAARGFSSVGLSALLQQAGVPKGSFYHYFKSKEQFGQAMLEHYFSQYLQELDEILTQPGQTGRERLMAYWSEWQRRYCNPQGRSDCLVVKLSAEVADLSEPMRLSLKSGTDRIIARLQACVDEAVADGSVQFAHPQQLACTLYQLWLGASLLTKLHRDERHLELAMTTTRELLAG